MYTTHRALYVYIDKQLELTKHSKAALKEDFDNAGCEVLKVDFNDKSYENAVDFMEHFKEIYRCDDSEVQYVRNKFVEYFVVND